MREETQVRERLERLMREGEVLRQQCARSLLSDRVEDWNTARDAMGRLRDNDTTIRALEWALGGKS